MSTLGKALKRDLPGNKTLARVFSVTLIIANLLAISTVARPGFEVYSGVAILVMLLLMFILASMQENRYWWVRKKKLVIDERQEFVRRRIFELAYKIAVIYILVLLTIILFSKSYLAAHILNTPVTNTSSILLIVAIFLYSLPTLIACWQKDS